MKMKVITATVATVLIFFGVQAQSEGIPNVVGTNHLLSSKILNEQREVQIYLPPDYQDSAKAYPVVYVLDGQRFFLHVVSLSQSFQQFQLTPEFIIVGINNSYPNRFRHFGEGKENFKGFLENELMPYVNENFRTKGENLLFGWEYGASFVFHMMMDQPTLFNAYLMASPFPIFDAIDGLDTSSNMGTQLYFAVSPDEYDVRHSTEKLNEKLTTQPIDGLSWKYFEFELEEHRSTGYPTLYHGLRDYFKYYQEFETNNLRKFINAGGMEYALNHAQERAKRYGFEPDLSLWSRFTIVRSAMRADDFYHFETLLHALDKDEFIKELLAQRDYAVSQIAAFYEKHNRFKETIELYDLLLKKYPDSERLLAKKRSAQSKL
ncbi:MAG: alpha/beta hydrolase-fold protein [Bacteroidota bacterium]|uniref:Alpha/beta hydrolase n=1 Tax=Flagellimonas profundi TaxID=2915620 RepID=A0ABS3FB80_9FLAO|nr:alpha/beta hydrolase-fold protein [Allomuricauda profundi]MBO0340408.1 alpha/beta hydrolase [Allomuricauda profundi]MEC7770296.1 alpha/beta hydrolase-fold protein [Bacteroidota bacterium]